jgi:hypothetical protein
MQRSALIDASDAVSSTACAQVVPSFRDVQEGCRPGASLGQVAERAVQLRGYRRPGKPRAAWCAHGSATNPSRRLSRSGGVCSSPEHRAVIGTTMGVSAFRAAFAA